MIVDITVHHAETLPNGYVRLITEITDPEGEQRIGYHFMPSDAVEWRVAQFNITPEEALDMVVAEPYIREDKSIEHDLQPTRSKARAMAKKAVEDAGTVTYAAGPLPSEMAASPEAVAESGEDDPKSFLLDVLPIDEKAIEYKRFIMDANRVAVQESAGVEVAPVARRTPPTPPPDISPEVTVIEESPSALAKRLIASRLEQVRTRRNVPS